jgi:hypothetical protein
VSVIVHLFIQLQMPTVLFRVGAMRHSSFQNILIPIFLPFLWYRLRRPESGKMNVNDTGNDEAAEIVETVDICSTDGDRPTHCTGKTHNVDENSSNACNLKLAAVVHLGWYISFRVEIRRIPVRSIRIGVIQIRNREVSFPDEIIIRQHDSSNTRKEDRVTIR